MKTICTVNSIILYIMFGYTFRKDVNKKLIVVPMFILTLRQEIRLIDLEQTFKVGSNAYSLFMLNQSLAIMTLFLFVSLYFHKIKGISILMSIQVVLFYLYFIYHFDNNSWDNFFSGDNFSLGYITFCVGIAFYQLVINYFMNNISRFYTNIIKA